MKNNDGQEIATWQHNDDANYYAELGQIQHEANEGAEITFEQAVDEVGSIYEATKSALTEAFYIPGATAAQRRLIDIAMENNVKMRNYACVALRKAYGIE